MNLVRPHRMLWSYHYAKRSNLADTFARMAHKPVVFADSGGFSALTQGVAIDVGEYADWLIEHRDRFEVYANLDAIGDAEGTSKNQDYLESRGLRPLPVYHGGVPQKWLDHYADNGHSYIALGGTVGISPAARMRWFVQAFKWARARREAGKSSVVFHGFGVTSVALLQALPWYSADSTSWNSGAQYGTLKLFDPVTGVWRQMQMFDPASVGACAPLVRHYGFRVDEFLDREIYHFRFAVGLAARSWRGFEDYCRALHGPIIHPDAATDPPPAETAGDAPGFNLFLVHNAPIAFEITNQALTPGFHGYGAATSRSDHTFANQALSPGLNLYLADGSQNNHAFANKALSGDQP